MKYPEVDGVRIKAESAVLRITLDSEKRRNALRDDAVAAIIDALVLANSDEQIRAILLTGANGNFCAGADIVARNAGKADRPRVGAISRRLPSQAHRLIPLLTSIQVPVVAAVRGFAVGLGMQLALASDFAVVSETATFWEPFAARGMGPDGGASWMLPRAVGPVRAREILLLGRRLSGAEAVEWGIAHRALPDEDVDAAADEIATQLALGPSVALGLTRMLINKSWSQPLDAHLAEEGYGMEISSRSPDFREGLSAFVERRPPKFSGK
ncbi:enoyl-CoA hydratase/isomerase family protein [Microbacterium sp. A84]|uniref:enoyl-CoA hydratase/isomerase family protein n=1 Tax=Microbacterium sp. A84 TaxID=3450715 RepID=UPI003F4268AD